MAMANVARHMGGSQTEIVSPSGSDTPIATSPHLPDRPRSASEHRSTSRQRRTASRVLLRSSFRNFSDVAEVVVGDDSDRSKPQTKYLVHKELLTAASPFFAAALNGTFAEGLDQTVRLPEEKPDSFEWFLQWLYTGSLTTPVEGSFGINAVLPLDPSSQSLRSRLIQDAMTQTDGDLRNQHGSPKYFLLIDLYALSDRLLTTQLSNHILSTMARLSEATNSVPTPSDTWILCDTIRDTSPLRTLVLDLFAYKKTDKLLESHKDEWHPKFLRELVVKLKRPGSEAIERHHLVAWRPRSWSQSKACEGCKETLKPGVSADKCCGCDKAFCGGCLRRHGEPQGWTIPHDTSGCKPWMGRRMCVRYHEHGEGESCGMGLWH